MARIFIDGFESGNLDNWVVDGPTISGSPPTGFSGSYYLNGGTVTSSGYMMLPSNKTELYVAFKYNGVSPSRVTSVFCFWDDAGTLIGGLYKKLTNRLLEFRLGNGQGTLLATGTTEIVSNATYLIEIHYKPLNSGGIFQVKVNGAPMEIDYSGDTTAGLENIRRIGWVYVNLNTEGFFRIDDIIIDDANWIGNTKIQALVPTGAGTTSQHTAIVNAHPTVLAKTNGSITGPYANARNIIDGSYITQSGSKIKIAFLGQYLGNTMNVAGCSIGLQDGSTSSFSGTPTRVTKNGSNSFTVPTGATIVYSDWITFNLVANTNYLVHLYFSGVPCYLGYSTDVSQTVYWEANADADDTESVSISGYTSTANRRYGIWGIFAEKTGGASNYLAVKEVPAFDIDYIKTGSGQIDTYQMGNLVGSIASIKSVAVQSRNWREGNGSYDRGQHIVRPASTDRLAASKTSMFPISPISFQSIWELNPEDSAAWEEADINGMEAGIKAVEA